MRYFHLRYRLSAAELPAEQELPVAVVHYLHTGQPAVLLRPEYMEPVLPAEPELPVVVLHMLAVEPESEHHMLPAGLPVVLAAESERHMLAVPELYTSELHLPAESMLILLLQAGCLHC
jgi:predicted TIM-barrel fold metal-dependent hydrolase